jgi:hypothetical protein
VCGEAGGDESAALGHGDAGDGVVVTEKKLLRLFAGNLLHHDRAAQRIHQLLLVWMNPQTCRHASFGVLVSSKV